MARLSFLYRKAIGQAQDCFHPGRGIFAGRKLAISLLWLPILLLISQTGCSVWDLARRTIRDEPDCYDIRPEEKQDLEQYRCWAVEAWQSVNDGTSSGPYYDGFLDGFVDQVYSGGNGKPPVIPPCQFWNGKNGDMSSSIGEWNAGFRRGAAAAKQGGYRDRVVVPISMGSGRQQRANVSGQCVANDSNDGSEHESTNSPSDTPSLRSDSVEFMEAPETGYESQDFNEVPGELPATENPENSPRWAEPENKIIELDPDERLESDGPMLGNPSGFQTPPESPNSDEMLDSLLPDSLEAPEAVPESDSIDLDDLFSASTQQPEPQNLQTNLNAPLAGHKEAATGRRKSPAYSDWSYGDIVAASQSEQTSSVPANVANQGRWIDQTSRPPNRDKPEDEPGSSADSGTIEFAQDFESYPKSRPKVRHATATKPDAPGKGNMTPLRNWRISDWQKKFSNGDTGPDAGEREGISFDAWERAYGKKK